jgi:hypothetical protein
MAADPLTSGAPDYPLERRGQVPHISAYALYREIDGGDSALM